MHLALTQQLRVEQTLSPRMIQFYQMLQCPLLELDGIISQELADNPALELIDRPAGDLVGEDDSGSLTIQPPSDDAPRLSFGVDELDDPVAAMPAPVTLQDHLRWHFMAASRTPEEERIGLRIIDDINADGYFEGAIGEVSLLLGANIVEVERVLELVQHLDPSGVGGRDLRECLQIQLRQLREQGRDHAVAWKVTELCWEPFCRRQYAACARKLRVSEAAVADAADFLRRNCHPYPGRQFRLPWQATQVTPRAWPEVRLLGNPTPPPRYLAEVAESQRLALRIDRVYRRLYDEIQHGDDPHGEEADHVTSCVRRARQFIRSIEQRRETVRRIAQEVANEQADFIAHGPSFLKPLTRLEMARRLDLHESTVGRAVAGKFVQLPSSEVIPFERFFDGAQPAKLALEELVQAEDKHSPLSDQTIAERLQQRGYDVARRTVAKYRAELKLPPASQRRR